MPRSNVISQIAGVNAVRAKTEAELQLSDVLPTKVREALSEAAFQISVVDVVESTVTMREAGILAQIRRTNHHCLRNAYIDRGFSPADAEFLAEKQTGIQSDRETS